MQRLERWVLVSVLVALCAVLPVRAQIETDDDEPVLSETFEGRGRLADVTFGYPAGWYAVEGIPINRLVSFNVVSSVRVGLRNQLTPGEEAIVFAFSGGRIDRWNNIEPDFTPEEILTAFIEQFGDGGEFAPEGGGDEAEDFETIVSAFTLNDRFDAVEVRFETPESDAEDIEESEDAEDAEPELQGTFIAYTIRLDDNRFMVVLAFTSELTYEQAKPTVDAVLASLDYDG